MSRTDHHAPAWVRTLGSTTATEHHSYGCRRSGFASQPSHEVVCDIDTPNGSCYRWDRDGNGRWTDLPTKTDIHLHFYVPERAHTRAALHEAARDYNTHGQTDIEPVSRQKRGTPWLRTCWCCI